MSNPAGYIVAKANATALPFVAKAEKERPEWIVLRRERFYSAAVVACGCLRAMARGAEPIIGQTTRPVTP